MKPEPDPTLHFWEICWLVFAIGTYAGLAITVVSAGVVGLWWMFR